ncbi:MAG: hypothetical protein WA709_34060 [Stellaceae bacterium]
MPRARGRTVVAVAEAADINQRNLRELRRLLQFLRRARENHAHIGAGIGRHVDPGHRFVEPFEAAGIAARNDHEILVGLVALAAGEFDLVDEVVPRNHMRDIFVVMRPLGKELVFDMDAADAGMDEFLDRAHRVQRLAEAGAAIRDDRHVDRLGDIAGGAHLLVHRQQRLGGAARCAGHEPAIVDGLEPEALDQPAAERVIGDGHIDEALLGEKPAQRRGAIDHGVHPEEACRSLPE